MIDDGVSLPTIRREVKTGGSVNIIQALAAKIDWRIWITSAEPSVVVLLVHEERTKFSRVSDAAETLARALPK